MIYAFGDYTLDDEALELRGPDGAVPVEPRVLETLIYLVRNRGRVVSKAELAENVWRAAAITDSAIARSVMGARRAVGDAATPPTVIRTVHGRGYRFDLPVEEVEAPIPRAPRSRRRKWLVPALAVAITVLAGLAITRVLIRVDGGPSARGGAIPLAVQVSAPAEDDELQLLARSVEEDLRRSLDRMPEVERRDGVGAGALESLLVLSLEPGETEGHAHLEAALRGGGEAAGPAPTLLLRHELPYRLSALDGGRFVAVQRAVVRRIVQRLGIALRIPSSPADASGEAWRLFLRATTEWKVACDGAVAAEQLGRSLELDPDSAAAWYQLALVRWSQVNFCSGGMDLLDEAEAALGRAVELEPDWPVPRHLQPAFSIYRGQVEEAYGALQELAAEYPQNLFIKVRTSQALRYAGFLDASRRAFDEALRDYPEASFLYELVPYPYLYEERWERFLGLLSGRDTPYFRYYRGYAQWMQGDVEAAQRVLEPAFVDAPGDPFARLCQALLADLRGAPEEARVVLQQLARQRAEQGAGDGEVGFKIGQLLILAGAVDEGLEQLSLAVDQGFFCPRCLASIRPSEPLTGSPRFRLLLASAVERHRRFADRFGLSPELPPGEAPP